MLMGVFQEEEFSAYRVITVIGIHQFSVREKEGEGMDEYVGPTRSMVLWFYLSFFLLILTPTIVLMIWGFTGPPPYLLERDGLSEKWIGMKRTFREYMVEVHPTKSNGDAKDLAKRLFDSTPAGSRLKTLNIYRYNRNDDSRTGLVIPLDEFVIRIEAADRDAVDKAFLKLPFISENPAPNPLYRIFDDHLAMVFAVIGIYVILLLLFFSKRGAAIAQIKPSGQSRPDLKGELKSQLLKLDSMDLPFSVKEISSDEFVCEWRLVDEKWSRIIRAGGLRVNHRINLQFDPEKPIVRSASTTKIIRWERGFLNLLATFNWSRSIDFYSYQGAAQYGIGIKDGNWEIEEDYSFQYNLNQIRDPIVRLIIQSGWVYRPVLGFSPFFN